MPTDVHVLLSDATRLVTIVVLVLSLLI